MREILSVVSKAQGTNFKSELVMEININNEMINEIKFKLNEKER